MSDIAKDLSGAWYPVELANHGKWVAKRRIEFAYPVENQPAVAIHLKGHVGTCLVITYERAWSIVTNQDLLTNLPEV